MAVMWWMKTLVLSLPQAQRWSDTLLPTSFSPLSYSSIKSTCSLRVLLSVLYLSRGWTSQRRSCTGQAGKVFLEFCLLSEVETFDQIWVLYFHNRVLIPGNEIKYWKDFLLKIRDWFYWCFAVKMWVYIEKNILEAGRLLLVRKKINRRKQKLMFSHMWEYLPLLHFSSPLISGYEGYIFRWSYCVCHLYLSWNNGRSGTNSKAMDPDGMQPLFNLFTDSVERA